MTAVLVATGTGISNRAAAPLAFAGEALSITANTVPFDLENPDRTRFGALQWRGSLELSAGGSFGGFSGISLSENGTDLVAISDRGTWLTAQMLYIGPRPSGLADADMSPLTDLRGRPLSGNGSRDAEGLVRIAGANGGEEYLVSFERRHRIDSYLRGPGGFAFRATLHAGDVLSDLPFNAGIEALGMLSGPGGERRIIALAEQALNSNGDHTGWLISPDGAVQSLFVKRSDGFDITDLAILPDGDMILLERRFLPLFGGAFRLCRIAAASIRPGAVLDGPVLIDADERFLIDNMEGLAVHRAATGETILTVISDDNFSPAQRTLLIQFALTEGD